MNNIQVFAQDDAADTSTLVKMFEQCLNKKLRLNTKHIGIKLMQNMIEFVWTKVKTMIDIQYV